MSPDRQLRVGIKAWEDDNGARCEYNTGFWVNDDDCYVDYSETRNLDDTMGSWKDDEVCANSKQHCVRFSYRTTFVTPSPTPYPTPPPTPSPTPPTPTCQCLQCNGVQGPWQSGVCAAGASPAARTCQNDPASGGCYSSLNDYACNCPSTVGQQLTPVFGLWTVTRTHSKWNHLTREDTICGKNTDVLTIGSKESKWCREHHESLGQVVVNQDGEEKTFAWFCQSQGQTEIVGTPTFVAEKPDGACKQQHQVGDQGK